MARRGRLRDDRGMFVDDCMSRTPQGVRVTDRLAAAAQVLWDHDCGFVPVLDADDRLVGVLTDRDLCMAAFTQGRPLHDLPVAAAMARQVRSVRADDTLATAMVAMQEFAVRRLPVVDADGRLVGVLSSNDLVRYAFANPRAVAAEHVLRTLAVVGRSRRAAPIEPGVAELAAPTVLEPLAPAGMVPAGPSPASKSMAGKTTAGKSTAGRPKTGKSTAGQRTVGKATTRPASGGKSTPNQPASRKLAARKSANGSRTEKA